MSTPFSSPPGFEWVWYVYLLTCAGFTGVLVYQADKGRKIRVFLLVALCYVVSAFPAFIWASLTPWPGGSLWFPGSERDTRIFAGLGWRDVGLQFAIVNFFAVGIVFYGMLGFARLFRLSKEYAEPRAVLMALLYFVCVLPFVFGGALSHGWVGGYVHGACFENREEMMDALAMYAAEHEGRLPGGEDIRAIHREILPYLEDSPGSVHLDRPVYICPVGASFEKNPEPYEWNPEVSGKSVPELEAADAGMVLIRCPYHAETTRYNLTVWWLSLQVNQATEKAAE